MWHIAKVCCICTLLVACISAADCGSNPQSCSQQDKTSLLQVRSNVYPGSQRLQAEAMEPAPGVLDEEEQAEKEFVTHQIASRDFNESGGNESGGNESGGNVSANWTDYLYAPLPKPIGPLISNGTEKEEKDVAKKSVQQELIGSLNKDASLDAQDHAVEEDKEELPAIVADAAANSSGNVSWKDYLPVHGQDLIVNWESEGETKELAALKNDSANVSANWTDYLPHNPSWIPYWVSKDAKKEDLSEPEEAAEGDASSPSELEEAEQQEIQFAKATMKNGTDNSSDNATASSDASSDDEAAGETPWVAYAMPEYPPPIGKKSLVQEAVRATTKNGTNASSDNATDDAAGGDEAGEETPWVAYAMPEYPEPLGKEALVQEQLETKASNDTGNWSAAWTNFVPPDVLSYPPLNAPEVKPS